MVEKAPFSPKVTSRRSESRPTQQNTMSWPLAASAGVAAVRSEERRVGKECRSRCDWSSDVCSSDLGAFFAQGYFAQVGIAADAAEYNVLALGGFGRGGGGQIGRASCRERV